MKKYIIGFILAATLAAVALWWFKFKNEPTLADLQKQYVLAKTEAEKNQVVDRLEQYYLNLSVPDSIRQHVDREVATQLDTTKISLTTIVPDTNVYRLESQLQSLLQKAVIVRARNENQTFQALIGVAKNLAQTVDTGTQNHYWVPFVDKAGSFTKEQAISWLKAKKAEGLCRLYHDTASKITDAESYASLGLKFLQQANDDRLRLDIIQRLQWILHRYHWRHELSIALAQKNLLQADKIKYHIRSNALIWVEAEAFSKMGQPQAALARYDTVFCNAEKFRQINGMSWLETNSLFGKGGSYVDLGEFEKGLAVCRAIERLKLSPADTLMLYLLKVNIFSKTKHYELAEEELRKAMVFADKLKDEENRIRCLNNLGSFYAWLGEYDLSLAHHEQARALFTNSFPSLSTRLMVLNNIAYRMTTQKDSIQFGKIIAEAQGLMRFADSPYMEAQLFARIGDWHQKAKQYRAAMEGFHKADSIFYQNGFLYDALGVKMYLVNCLILLARFDEARGLIAQIEPLAKGINDLESLIEAHDRTAQIRYREGKIAQAIASSKLLLHEIATMSSRFNNPDRLIAYRQKIYDFLKHAVLYEIALQNMEAAFVKLDEAKSYVLNNRLANGQADPRYATPEKAFDLSVVKSRLDAKSLLLDYMITPDTLYVFVLDQGGMQLLRKKIDMEALGKMTISYRDSINKTMRIFQHHNTGQASAHYTGTVTLGQKLYRNLLGWPEIELRLQQIERLYIVPDEFLYLIPFSTLIADHSRTQTFLVNRIALLTLPSVSFLANKSFTNGTLNQPNPKKVLMSVDRRFPGSENFIAKVKTLFPLAEELAVQDSSLSKETVLAQLQKKYQIFIFLGHGQANPQYPEDGYIELSVKTPHASTGKIIQLKVADLKTINWLGSAEMVMLVGCETASGKLYRGTGISGLQQEFLSLGVKNILGNLWEVDATHAIVQAEDFLTTWVMTWNPSYALQESQRKTIQALREHRYYQQPHPYFWGSSVLLTATAQ